MNSFIIPELTIPWLVIGFGCWLGWQLLRQNGRIVLRLEALEQRLAEWELANEPGGNGKSQLLARSRLTRDGLRAGTPASNFRLPRVDGGELTLEEFRGRRVLLVFSEPECGPCNQLAPQLERFHRNDPEPRL
jgi:thiol-disulfide isomerase/thioredoxin